MQISHALRIIKNSQSSIEFIHLPIEPMLSPIESKSINFKHYSIWIQVELGVLTIKHYDKFPIRKDHETT